MYTYYWFSYDLGHYISSSGSSAGTILPHRGCLAMSGDIFDGHTEQVLQESSNPGMLFNLVRVLHNKELLSPKYY